MQTLTGSERAVCLRARHVCGRTRRAQSRPAAQRLVVLGDGRRRTLSARGVLGVDSEESSAAESVEGGILRRDGEARGQWGHGLSDMMGHGGYLIRFSRG